MACGTTRPPTRSSRPGSPGWWSARRRWTVPSGPARSPSAGPDRWRSGSTSGVARWRCGAGSRGAGRDLLDVAAELDDAGFAALIVTQINVDGAGTGPDVQLYADLLEQVETDVIASGGVGSVEHLRTLAGLDIDGRGLAGVIVGRALYDGSVTIDDALAAAETA